MAADSRTTTCADRVRGKRAAAPFVVGDLWGGMAAAAVVLPQAVAFGVVLVGPTGLPSGCGALMGLIGAALLSLTAGVIGRANGMISSPTGPSMVLLAGALAALMANDVAQADLLPALAVVTLLGGIFQILIGASGGGTLVKFIPYPVVAGFMTGAALLMLKSQWAPLSGQGFTGGWEAWRWVPGCTALVTWLSMQYAPRLVPAVPGVIAGLIGGAVVFHLIVWLGPGPAPPSWVVAGLPEPDELSVGFALEHLRHLPWLVVVSSALALAVLCAINTLLVAVLSDVTTESRHNSTRELVAQGVAMAITGAVGGMAGSATTGATMISLRTGGRRWAAVVCGVSFVLLVFGGRRLAQLLPIGVLAGIIVAVAVSMVEPNAIAWLRQRRTRMDGVITLVVTFVTVLYDLISAIAAGLAIAIALFLRAQIEAPVVHRRSTGANVRSVRIRSQGRRELLRRHGNRIVLYELRGSLFFATADRLYKELVPDLQGPNWVILHLRRVSQVDLTGVKILQQIAAQLNRNGGELIFCNVHGEIGLGRHIEHALRTVSPSAELRVRTFNGLDESLEYAEDALLADLGQLPSPLDERVPFERSELCRQLPAEAVQTLGTVMSRRTVCAGEKIFAEGEPGDQLYVVLQGEIDIVLPITQHHHKRLAKCGAGSFFGELAFLVPGSRAADAVAVTDCDLRVLDRTSYDQLVTDEPRTAVALLLALSAEQVAHQRWSTDEIQRLSMW
jgi:SulP family sulfate permease